MQASLFLHQENFILLDLGETRTCVISILSSLSPSSRIKMETFVPQPEYIPVRQDSPGLNPALGLSRLPSENSLIL